MRCKKYVSMRCRKCGIPMAIDKMNKYADGTRIEYLCIKCGNVAVQHMLKKDK